MDDERGGSDADEVVAWRLHAEQVRQEWIDYNGHMNVAFYVLVFDHATDAVLEALDLGERHRRSEQCSVFVGEAHVTYEQEVALGDLLEVESRILDCDGKRLILYHEMRCGRIDGIVASNEVLCMNVSLRTRRVAPLPEPIFGTLSKVVAAQRARPRPARAGRSIGLKNRRPA
jgi:acyl-CoA thioester hydrolase